MRHIYIFIIVGLTVFGCKKKEDPKAPESAKLISPALNSECITGQSLNATTSNVEFKWSASNYTDSYELNVKNLSSGSVQRIPTTSLSAVVPLSKGSAFSWFVKSMNEKVSEVTLSSTWYFYNAGDATSHPPFPAAIVAPEPGASVLKDVNNEVSLEWTGSDLDNDIAGYDVYFSEENPPVLLESLTSTSNKRKVTVEENKVYYWKVVTKDREGNTSDTGVNDFRVY